jgi:predicted metal-dependent hydrolase
MTRSIHVGTPPIEVHLHRSARARRYSLRVSNTDGTVRLTLPLRASEAGALDFARDHEGWLRRALDRRPDMIRPAPGGSLPFEGVPRAIRSVPGRGVVLDVEGFAVGGRPDQAAARLAAWLKQAARDRLAERVEHHAAMLGRRVGPLALRDTRSRWGSCSSTGRLMFSWRLVMAPPSVLDYVAAHEVAHLVEMNHSARYWAVLGRLRPDFQADRAWLKREGASLHRYRFERDT